MSSFISKIDKNIQFGLAMNTIKGCLTVADPGTKGLGVPFSEPPPPNSPSTMLQDLLDFYFFVAFPKKSCKIGKIP